MDANSFCVCSPMQRACGVAIPMPSPLPSPPNFETALQSIGQILKEETNASQARHEKIMNELQTQQKLLKEVFEGMQGTTKSTNGNGQHTIQDPGVVLNWGPPDVWPGSAPTRGVQGTTKSPNANGLRTVQDPEASTTSLTSLGSEKKVNFEIPPPPLIVTPTPKVSGNEVGTKLHGCDDGGHPGNEQREVEETAAGPTLSRELSRNSKLADALGKRSKSHETFDKATVRGSIFKTMRMYLVLTVSSEKFEILIALFILANAIVLTAEVQYKGFDVCFDLRYIGCDDKASIVWPSAESVFTGLDWMFGFIFIMEAAAKILSFGHRYFMCPWNAFDILCVLAFLADKISSAFLPIDGNTFRLLRLCRLVRLVKLLRFLESLDVLFIMTTAIKGMTRVIFWAIALLSVMLMTVALLLSQILHAYYFKDTKADTLSTSDLEVRQKLFEYFGTFTRCFLSMFELTLANWPPITRLLAENVSEWFMLLCMIHKLTIGFAVIGVVNGVIMQETFKVAATDDMIMVRQKKKAMATGKKKMEILFEALDHSGDGNGALELEEFQVAVSDPNVKTWLASMDIETDDAVTLFNLIDADKSGTITAAELMARMPRIKGAARSIDVLAMSAAVNKLALQITRES